ncbi:transglycosylase domain-containing protein [Vulcanococcus sp. Clear-D1]|uniref:transglycosylase domain-containing protein n=1 Tax=Vulcanococcus sp. Clear-D1 TaxID=2766970 RepID=UPI0025E8F37F|nr:PBP1A family penicillin-binding protein [Vulcanococcus sp. Clear-D1]
MAVAVGQNLLVQGVDALLPNVQRVSSYNRPGTVTVLSADGQVIQKLGPATREKLISGQMPLLVQRAFIAAEDRRFYEHDGIDPVGISRALLRNVRRGAVEEGASTITQQLARTVFLSQDRTIIRKLKEALLAGKLERQLSKQQILEQYLNFVYLGSSAYGVSDAAWIYFSKTPAELTLPEAALIAGLPPAPSVYSPLVNPDLALERRATVLRRMREAGFIDDLQLQSANAAPLLLKPAEPKYWTSRAPYFTSWVAQELPKVLSPEDLEVGGLTIRSSLNLAWQERAQATINKHAPGAMEGAVVSMEPGTGLVRTMVGGKDFETSQFNRAAQALRSPGSTFKLFVYLTALKEGMKPEDKVNDKPQCFGGYCPRNFGNKYRGVVPLWVALQQSLNTVSVSLLKQLGFDKVIATAKSLGITRELGRFYPLAVGATEQTVLDMTAAYAAIFNRGVYVTPTPFEEILGPNGELLWSRRVDGDRGRRAVPSDIADAMLWMLQQVVKGGTGYGAVPPDRPAAGKTGTSEGGRDLWFIGGVPQLVTGLWLGYDNNKETKSTSAVAVVAWADYMGPILKDLPVRQFPPKPQLAGKFDPLKVLKPKPEATAPATTPAEPLAPGPNPEGPAEPVIPEGTPSGPGPAAPAAAPAPVAAPPAPPPPLAPPAPPSAPPPLP